MTYGFAISQQLEFFLYSLGFGFLLGLLYRTVMSVREAVSRKKAAYVAFDLLFCVTATILTFCFLLIYADGQIRLISLFADAVGFTVYLFSADFFMKKLITYPIKAVVFPFKLLLVPFRAAIRYIGRFFRYVKGKALLKKSNNKADNGKKKHRDKKPKRKRPKTKEKV